MTDRTNATLGKYRLRTRLGEGGMGAVYHAVDDMLGRDVAIKVLRPELVQDQSLVNRFRTEAIALARLAHPRIATLYGLERDGDELYMVMEYLPGETLDALLRREGRLPWARAAALCVDITEALEHAHQQGVVHRDIKPANVMVGPAGGVKVMDFGIARMTGSQRQTRYGHAVGTPTYMAPEQLRGEECDGRTDLYAVGALLYELVTGQAAFVADSDYALVLQQLHDEPRPPSTIAPSLPPAADDIVLRAMAKRAPGRFANAAAMRMALCESLADTAVQAAPPTREPRVRFDWRTWSTAAMVLATAVVLLRSLTGGTVRPLDGELRTAQPADSPRVAQQAVFGAPIATDSMIRVTGTVPVPPRAASPGVAPGSAPVVPGRVPAGVPVRAPTRAPERSAPLSPATDGAQEDERVPVVAERASSSLDAAREVRSAERAVGQAVDAWLAGLAQKRADGLAGRVDGENAAQLVREGRLGVASHRSPSLTIAGEGATASVSAQLSVRSAFGATRQRAATFQLVLSRNGASWRVTRVTVSGSP